MADSPPPDRLPPGSDAPSPEPAAPPSNPAAPVTPGDPARPGPSTTPDAPPPASGAGGLQRDRSGNRNTTAIILIVVGIVLLAGRGFGARLDNWWALFILIPAFGSLSTAWRAYQASDGELTYRVTGPGITGAILLVVAAVFLFGLDWSLTGAIVLVLLGAGLLLRRSA